MAKKFSLIVIVMLASCVAFGQTAKPKLDQVKKDPKTTENAAKADAQLVIKKNVADQASFKPFFSKKRQMNSKRRKNLPRKSS